MITKQEEMGAIADRMAYWRILADWPYDEGPGTCQGSRAVLTFHFGVVMDKMKLGP